MLGDPAIDPGKGGGEVDAVDGDAENLDLFREALLDGSVHFVSSAAFVRAACSSTASVSAAAFSQEKRFTFS